MKGEKNKYELWVKWENYDASDNTWEPLEELYASIKDLVVDYFSGQSLQVVVDQKTGKQQISPKQKKTSPSDKKLRS